MVAWTSRDISTQAVLTKNKFKKSVGTNIKDPNPFPLESKLTGLILTKFVQINAVFCCCREQFKFEEPEKTEAEKMSTAVKVVSAALVKSMIQNEEPVFQ